MIGYKVTVNIPPHLMPEIAAKIDKLQAELAYRIVEESRRLIDSSTPSGRLYARGSFRRGQSRQLGARARGSGVRIHRASSAGQPPAEDTGKLYQNIRVSRISSGAYRIRFGADYAGYIEFGTSGMKARPFIMPAIEIAVDKVFNGTPL